MGRPMTVHTELLFHLEAASAYAEQGGLHDIRDDIESLIRRVRKDRDDGDDAGRDAPAPRDHSEAFAR